MILLVEDNPDDEALMLRALRRNAVMNEVVVARDGDEALALLFGSGINAGRNLREMPEVILLDLKLPKVDGHEVLRRIRADARMELVPVVVLSSSTEREDVASAYRERANSYVRKPVNYLEFTEQARQIALYWLAVNYSPPS